MEGNIRSLALTELAVVVVLDAAVVFPWAAHLARIRVVGCAACRPAVFVVLAKLLHSGAAV